MSGEFVPFELERWMSTWENIVEFNLSESGVHPMTVEELVEDPQRIEDLLSTGLNYPQTNGLLELRERIADLYPHATSDNVLVTTGAAQANFTSIWTLLEPNDEIAVMLPNYMQIWGLAQNFRLKLQTFSLEEKKNWTLDLDALSKAVTKDTKLIAVCNPNNPTGHIFTTDEMEAIVSIADRVGAWLLADEVYAGAERTTDETTPSFWGRYDRVLAVGSMSKAYGLPGLRLGWVVAPEETVEALWSRQDYITIGNTMLANKLAAFALDPQVLSRIVARTRDYIRKGYDNFELWAQDHEDLFSWVPPQAAAVVFVRYARQTNSTELCERLIREESAYVVPGDHFGMDGYLRISFGLPKEYLLEGLKRVHRVVASAK
jgi:aspartate/methionine/tyrosine aminotransferase